MDSSFELDNLSADPGEEWERMLRFVDLGTADRAAMVKTVEVLLRRSTELVVETYTYLQSFPETAAILGWEQKADPEHLEERRRFFTVWLARSLGLDTSIEFANYLFKAGQYHAGHGPRKVHTPTAYVNTSIGLVLASFARYMNEANLPTPVAAPAMAGWSKYLMVQLNQMQYGYEVAREFAAGEFDIKVEVFGRLRSSVGAAEMQIPAAKGATVATLLNKFFNYYHMAREDALERVWHSEEKANSMWVEIKPAYKPKTGWRVLLNGRDLMYEHGFSTPLHKQDTIAIFPPGR